MASLTVRKNVESLTPPELQALREALLRMQSIWDNRGYNYFAGLHGIPNWYCNHHDRSVRTAQNLRLFLPWHRAYLLYFEKALRDQAGPDPKIGLPWWDWTSPTSHTIGVPTAFVEPAVDGRFNPLSRAAIYAPAANPPIWRWTRRFPGDPRWLPSGALVDSLLNLSQFRDFSIQLEDVHDYVHGWAGGNNGSVGGDMGNLGTAAWDPLFWIHHCTIDRIWYMWQLRQGVNNISPELLPVVLQPFSLTVEDVLNVNALGYEYAISKVAIR
jgi:tyrosinase